MTEDQQDALMDQFAMAALTGMLANPDVVESRSALALAAYGYAKEMMKAKP